MNEQKQDLLAFLRELQGVIERHRASIMATHGRLHMSIGDEPLCEATIWSGMFNGECPSLAEEIERLESEIAPQRETPDEDGTSYL